MVKGGLLISVRELSSNSKVVVIDVAAEKLPVIPQAWLEDLVRTKEGLKLATEAVNQREARIAQLIRSGAKVEPGEIEFDPRTMHVHRSRG
jgi:FMN-dependent NADH-azoreductase